MSDVVNTGPLSLRDAVLYAVRSGGVGILDSRAKFLGVVLDLVDPDAPTTLVLEFNCDDEFLQYFRQAAALRTAQALGDAEARAASWLAHERMIESSVARQVTHEIADALGTALQLTDARAAQQSVAQRAQRARVQAPERGSAPASARAKASPTPVTLTGQAAFAGDVDGVRYELDTSDANRDCAAVVRLFNTRSDKVNVEVRTVSPAGGHHNATCKNLGPGAYGVVTFAKPIRAAESLAVETSRGPASDRRFACVASREAQGAGSKITITVTNVSKQQARVKDIVVLSGLDGSALLVSKKQHGLAPQESMSTHFYEAGAPHSIVVCINGTEVAARTDGSPVQGVRPEARGRGAASTAAAKPAVMPTAAAVQAPTPGKQKAGGTSRPDYQQMIANLQLSSNAKERRSQLSKAGVAMTLYNLVIWIDCWVNAAYRLYHGVQQLSTLQYATFRFEYPSLWGIMVCDFVVSIALAVGWVYVRSCLTGFKRGAPQKYIAIIVLQLVLVAGLALVAQNELVRLGWMDSYNLTGIAISAVWDVAVIAVMSAYFKKRAALFDL